MTDMQTLYLLVPLAPLAGAILAGLFGKTIGRTGAHIVTILGVAIALAASVVIYQDVQAGNTFNGTLYTWSAIGGILYTGIFPGFLGYVFYNAGVAAVGPARGSLFIHLMPVFATLLAAIFLDERPYLYHFVGIALVFAGIYLTTRRQPV